MIAHVGGVPVEELSLPLAMKFSRVPFSTPGALGIGINLSKFCA